MRRLQQLLLFAFLLVTSSYLSAQNNFKESNIEELIQQLFQQQDIAINYEDYYESMYQFYNQPINLNKAARSEIEALHILSPLQLESFLNYRKELGELVSKLELQAIPNIDLQTINRLLIFGFVLPKEENLAHHINARNASATTYLILRATQTMEEARGFKENKFAGSPQQVYCRFRSSQTRKYSFGFTAEKDAGEAWWWKDSIKPQGPDFLSAHFAVYNYKKLKTLIFGDYQLQYGQSLTMGSGFNFGKGGETITTVKRNNLGARPFTSVLENGYLRGLTFTYALDKRLNISPFVSSKKIDGNIISNENLIIDESTNISSLITSGLHRTARELENRKNINETTFGGNISYQSISNDLHVGITNVTTNWSHSLSREDKLYNKYELSGNSNMVNSIDATYYHSNYIFFGEAAMSSSSGKAFNLGVISSLTKRLDVSILYRRFDRNFHSLYAKAFAESYRTINEEGIYWGVKYTINKTWTIAGYYDVFKFPWLKFRVDAPSYGNEAMCKVTWMPAKTTVIYAMARWLDKQRNITAADVAYNFPVTYTKANFVADLRHQASNLLTVRSRVQGSFFRQLAPKTYGYYMMQEAICTVNRWLKISGRFALFDSDDFDNRQYAFEKDVLYAFSIPMMNGRGSRVYLLAQFRASKNVNIWIKYAVTKYKNVETIGSSWDKIDGSTQTDWRVQLQWKI